MGESAELERLRTEVETLRNRELDDLRTRLAEMTAERDHFRVEANRNADVGREIHALAQQQIDFLKAENKILKQQVKGRIRLNDTERRTLAELGKPLGRRI